MESKRRVILSVGVLSAVLLLAGATSASAANKFAVVNANGSLAYGSGVSTVTHIGIGQYEVKFSANVSTCAYVATTVNIYSQALQVFTAGGHLSATNGVYVETKNQGGGLTDGKFHLFVACAGATGIKYAVVGDSANLVRSTAGTTLTDLGFGRYEVVFTGSVSSCAFLASVGDPANALVFSPAGVYTGTGSIGRAVYIETKNPGGGLSTGIPFHLAVVCPTAAKSHIAVVNANGIPKRGSALTSSFNSATGIYGFVTNVAIVPNCAAIVTRGSVDTSVPFNPATVETINGPGANTVGIDMRELLFFGGAAYSDSFHVAAICK